MEPITNKVPIETAKEILINKKQKLVTEYLYLLNVQKIVEEYAKKNKLVTKKLVALLDKENIFFSINDTYTLEYSLWTNNFNDRVSLWPKDKNKESTALVKVLEDKIMYLNQAINAIYADIKNLKKIYTQLHKINAIKLKILEIGTYPFVEHKSNCGLTYNMKEIVEESLKIN